MTIFSVPVSSSEIWPDRADAPQTHPYYTPLEWDRSIVIKRFKNSMKLRVPTELTDKQIEDFQRIYKKTFGDDISRDEAIEEGLCLIRLIAIILNYRKEYSRTKNRPSSHEG